VKRRAVAQLRPGVDPRGSTQSGGLLSTAEIDRLVAFLPENLTEIARELKNLVVSVCPQVTERILWGALSYHDESKGGPIKGGVCQIEIQRDHVRLSFVHGARLRDPKHLLHGDRLSKRHVVLKSYDLVPWSAVLGLVQEAASLDPSTFGPLGPARN